MISQVTQSQPLYSTLIFLFLEPHVKIQGLLFLYLTDKSAKNGGTLLKTSAFKKDNIWGKDFTFITGFALLLGPMEAGELGMG